MKKQLILGITMVAIGLMLLISSLSYAQNANYFTVPLSDPAKRGKLKAHLNSGSITVKGTARKDVLIKYTSTEVQEEDDDKSGPKSGLRKIGGGGMDLEVTENENFVKVESQSWKHALNLEVEIPAGFDLEVSTYNDGDLLITNIQGEVELTNYNGKIQALNISGSVIATTYNGEVKVTFDKVSDDKPMSFTTYNGNIDLTFPASLKASLKMKTEQGEIYTDFDVTIKNSGPVQKKDVKAGVYKVTIDEWKRADVNGGGAEITTKNYNGDIYIRKK